MGLNRLSCCTAVCCKAKLLAIPSIFTASVPTQSYDSCKHVRDCWVTSWVLQRSFSGASHSLWRCPSGHGKLVSSCLLLNQQSWLPFLDGSSFEPGKAGWSSAVQRGHDLACCPQECGGWTCTKEPVGKDSAGHLTRLEYLEGDPILSAPADVAPVQVIMPAPAALPCNSSPSAAMQKVVCIVKGNS